MEHPLAMGLEAMRRAVMRRSMRWLPGWPIPRRIRCCAAPTRPRCARGSAARTPEQPGDYGAVLARVIADVLPYAARTDHPGYLAFIPSFTTWPAALAELTAAAANPYCGAWMEAADAQVELEVIDWFRSWLGLPAGTAGVLVSGGSTANLTALLVAREAAGGPSAESVVYVSDQAHSSLARTARAMGLRPQQVRVLPTDDRWRLRPAQWPRLSGLTATRAGSRSPCAPALDRPTPAPSIPSGISPMCAPPKGCGCTSMRRMAASPPLPRRDGRCWPASIAPTR